MLYGLLRDPEYDMKVRDITQWCEIVDRGGLFHATPEFKRLHGKVH